MILALVVVVLGVLFLLFLAGGYSFDEAHESTFRKLG